MREPIDVTLAWLDEVRIGRFRCPTSHARFTDSGPTRGWLVVFPRSEVWITHAGREGVLADATRAVLYNRGQAYRRARIADEGDRCEWFSFSPRAIAEAHARFAPAAIDRGDHPFEATNAPVDARTYALQRRVVHHVERGAPIDTLFVEEASLAILARVVAAIPRDRTRDAPPPKTARDHAEIARAVLRILAERAAEPLPLTAIAREVGRSPFHVARVFRAQTGTSIHAHRTQLRLRASLERVAAGDDLTRVALDLGFSSHAHFTTAFTRTFGEAPSAFRASSSKKMKAVKARLESR
jgi:AraC-like DNA-binding protein